MVRTITSHPVVFGETDYFEFVGLSTDEKPTKQVATGSSFLEVDTGDVYLFDEAGETWNRVG